VLISNHRVQCPAEETGWHHDGDAVFDEECNYLQCFYYPEDVAAPSLATRTPRNRSRGSGPDARENIR
jgi:hypothetical protein